MEENKYRLEDFELYQAGREFRNKIYQVIRRLPADERYCLGPQMRRAAISVTNNIAEGHGRWHFQENTRFCRIARGSVDEIVDDLNICLDQSYIDPSLAELMKTEAYELIRRLNSYIAYLQKSKQGQAL